MLTSFTLPFAQPCRSARLAFEPCAGVLLVKSATNVSPRTATAHHGSTNPQATSSARRCVLDPNFPLLSTHRYFSFFTWSSSLSSCSYMGSIAPSTRTEASEGGLGEHLVHRDVRRYDRSDSIVVLQARFCVRLFLHLPLASSANPVVAGYTQCSELGAQGSKAEDGGPRRADRVQAFIIIPFAATTPPLFWSDYYGFASHRGPSIIDQHYLLPARV